MLSEIVGVGKVLAELGSSLVSAAEEATKSVRVQLAAEYAVARANLATAEALVKAAQSQQSEQAQKTLAAVRNILQETETNLTGKVLALGFHVRQDVRDLFARAKSAAEFVARLPVEAAKAAGFQFATTTVAGVAGLIALGWWFLKGPGRR